MSRTLNDLTPQFRPMAVEWIARCIERGVQVMIVDTLRTPQEHDANLKAGTSAATLSNHLPRQLRMAGLAPDHPAWGKSDAIDLCPWEIWSAVGTDKLLWNTSAPEWRVLRDTAKQTRGRWGGDWYAPDDPKYLEFRDPKTVKPYDPGHLELPRAMWS
jgi:hypothetical protein